jgi:uncharacterized membrane protein
MDEPLGPSPRTTSEAVAARPGSAGRHARRPGRGSATRLHRLLLAVVVPLVTAAAAGLVLLWPRGALPPLAEGLGGPPRLVDATVLERRIGPCRGTRLAQGILCQVVAVELSGGARDGERAELQILVDADVPTLHPGDEVVLGYSPERAPGQQYSFHDFQRRLPLLLLLGLFALSVLGLGRWQGLRALAGLAISLAVVLAFVLPAILDGANPVLVALVGATVIATVTLYVAHGFSAQTTVALLGTLTSLALVGLLAWGFIGVTRLTGLASQEAILVQLARGQVNLEGLLLAGVILGTLGVLDDVTVTQVSAVSQLRRANPALPPRELYRSAVAVGRDHIASTVNTLVLAYTGASLPLLLLVRQASRPLTRVLTGEAIATEIVRTLVGSVGLVASVPLTTLLAALLFSRMPAGAPAGQVGQPGHRH